MTGLPAITETIANGISVNVTLIFSFERYKAVIEAGHWKALEARGASKQRPLWASTGVKNPGYSDTLTPGRPRPACS